MKLIDWILGREPVATATGIAAVVTAALGAAAAFGAPITETQIAALGALAAALAGWAARTAVKPVLSPAERELDRMKIRPLDDAGQALLVAVLVVLVLAIVGLFTVCTPGENDHGLGKAQLVSHRYDERPRCYDEYECDDEGGDYQGGPSGGRYEGGRGGSDYDGDGDGPRCRNFCFYGVPYPGQPGTGA